MNRSITAEFTPAQQVFRQSLPRDPSCGRIARRLLEAHLGERFDGELDDAKTVASELVNNAYIHGEGPIELRVCAQDARLRIEVIDSGNNSALVAMHLESCGTHGLGIVYRLAQRSGTREGTTHVWAELPIPPDSNGAAASGTTANRLSE